MRDRLRAGLKAALRERDGIRVNALRTTLAALDNAEAVEPGGRTDVVTNSSHIAGAVHGIWSSDVARRTLTGDSIRSVIRAEIDDRQQAAAEYERFEKVEEAARLRAEAAVLHEYISDGS